MGKESERIKFKQIPAVKVLSILHRGAYDEIGEALAHIMKYVEDNGYKVAGLARECYNDGIWNKEFYMPKNKLGIVEIPRMNYRAVI